MTPAARMDPHCDAYEQIKQLVLKSPDDCKTVVEQVAEIALRTLQAGGKHGPR